MSALGQDALHHSSEFFSLFQFWLYCKKLLRQLISIRVLQYLSKIDVQTFFIILLFHSKVKFFLVLLATLFTFIQCFSPIFRIFYLPLLLFSVTPVLLSVPTASPVVVPFVLSL